MTDVAARNKRNRRKGAAWQSELRDGLRNQGLDVERLALTGTEDEGDHVVRGFTRRTGFVVIEAKAAVMDPATFVKEALVEADHFASHRGLPREDVLGIAVVKRPRKNWRDAYVLTTLGEFFGMEP